MSALSFAATALAICVAAWATRSLSSQLVSTGVFTSDQTAQNYLAPNQTINWDIIASPSENTTGHLVFQSVSSLLQHWPNARYRNGHTIVPGSIPAGTAFYHGRSDSDFPKGAEWLATDPEHSFLFCKRPCWHLTVVTTRPLKVLYFDGSSAVKMHGGSMDSQDLLLWGERKADKVFSEVERLELLCKWGKQFDLDGFVRMEMNFEVMLCDFESGVDVVSFLQLANASPSIDPKPPSPVGNDDLPLDIDAETDFWTGNGPNPAVTIRNFELMHSSGQYHGYPGETRVRLDLTRLVSFFDPELAPSLLRARNELKGRWLYDLVQIESREIDMLHRKLREALLGGTSARLTSGVDWEALFQVVIRRYGSRLDSLHYVLGAVAGDATRSTILDEEDRVLKAFAQVNVMLSPYIPYGSNPAQSPGTSAWAAPVFEMCSTIHTSHIAKNLSHRMTASEALLLRAVQDTTKEICRVLVKMWTAGVQQGLDSRYWVRRTQGQVQGPAFQVLARQWRGDLEHLMSWLDWHIWTACKPACGDEVGVVVVTLSSKRAHRDESQEMCYMPTWPFFGGPPPGPAAGGPESPANTPASGNEWERPIPKCIRKIPPYSF
ncbi:hypothetical protein D9757_006956 [Collybiopsis confluens]|uniref:Uncharacterized protein n=1 Tax=Collybiopsis confluens TaxID=2823264 RepID=A0A8H5HIR3_9AGAR|nr:hypothetical protein D9757_006956 [Collybiopsis confluens]